jgi:PAS domain S-box-containing protein
MGGINQSLFLLAALFVGQGSIPGQGSAAVPLLAIGLLLSWAATPGWTELILMYPNRVGGIAATCAEAFRPYSPILANLTGVCYWWGWVPTCGLTALFSAAAIHECVPWVNIPILASCLVLFFTSISLCGVKWVMRLAMPIATASAALAFLSAVIPIFSGKVDWHQAFTYHLTLPFAGTFGQLTSIMAGLYLIGFAAPAFEQAACHVGETINPNKNVPRAMFASAALASIYFIILPVIWLGTIGPVAMGSDNLAAELGPTFAPLFGGLAKAAAIGFMTLNMFHGTIAPLAGAARTLSQLAEDGLLPEFMARRSKTDAPWVTTLITAGMAIAFLLIGDPVWLVAAANLTYLIGIGMPNVAVWLLRRNHPEMERPYRAPRGTITLGVLASAAWALTTVLGFQQFGLPTVIAGIGFAYSGSVLYAWRKITDRRKAGLPAIGRTLHLKLTGAMLLVLVLDGAGYLIAVAHVPTQHTALITLLEDIFVVVALLTISVGLILPGMIAHAAVEVSKAADRLVAGTLADFTRAMHALAAGDLDGAQAHFDLEPVTVHSHDEVGDMAVNFNRLQEEIGRAALGLEGARAGLFDARAELTESNERLWQAERKISEEKLQSLRNQHAVILNSVGEGVHGFDLQGRVNFENPAAAKMLGYESSELIGARIHCDGAGGPADCSTCGHAACQIRATLESGAARRVKDSLFRRKDGSFFPVDYTCSPVHDGDGVIVGTVVVFTDITERRKAEVALVRANTKLVEVSRQAGMAEVATSVLHNVGNVLNSVNVSCAVIAEKVQNSKITSVQRTADLLRTHSSDLSAFFSQDAQGQKLPEFLEKLAGRLTEEQATLLSELQSLDKNIEHIKQIVVLQQNHANVGSVCETLQISTLMEDALMMSSEALLRHQVQVIRNYSPVPPVSMDKHQVLQILVNLVQNAKYALVESGRDDKHLEASIESGDGFVRVSVKDNGVGIRPDHMTRIFAHGFTTKKDGHGFGLHSGVLAAQLMRGSLTVHSDGPGTGATFALSLPLGVNEN